MTGMKSLWGRKVSDLGFGDFLTKLQYIAVKKGKTIFVSLTNGIRQARLIQLAAQSMITLNSVIGIGSVQAATHSWIEIATLRSLSTG